MKVVQTKAGGDKFCAITVQKNGQQCYVVYPTKEECRESFLEEVPGAKYLILTDEEQEEISCFADGWKKNLKNIMKRAEEGDGFEFVEV